MSFVGKWPGECAQCGEETKGTLVEYNYDNEIQHVLCPEEQGLHGKPRPVCPQCFCVMPSTGRCDCRD